MAVSLTSQIKSAPNVISSELDGALVLLNPDSDQYFGVNKVGLRIWRLAEGGGSVESIVSKLVDEFEVSREDCENQTLQLVEEMLSNDLLVLEGA